MRVGLWSAFDPYSGYGRDAIDMARFLSRQGVDLQPLPTSLLPPVPRDFSILLEKDPRGAYDVVLCFGPPQDVKPNDFAHLARGGIAVGWSMWEKLPMIHQNMQGGAWGNRQKVNFWSNPHPHGKARPLDLFLVTCDMNVEAFRNIERVTPIDVVPCGIDTSQWTFARRDMDRPMTFGMIGMLTGRKDPFTLLTAWRELFDEVPGFDAQLKLHTMTEGMHPQITDWYPNVTLTDRAMDVPGVARWYHSIDVLVTTSRGEGNNKPAMEAMCSGATVIGSDWRLASNYDGPGDGHANWHHEGATFAARGELCFDDQRYGVRDFRVSKDHLKELIVKCWKDRPMVADMGVRASNWIRESLPWEKVTRDLEARLEKALLEKRSQA